MCYGILNCAFEVFFALHLVARTCRLYDFSCQLFVRAFEPVTVFNPLKPELNPICYLLALLGAHHFLHVSRIRVKLLTLR